MTTELSPIRSLISPGRYAQGRGALTRIGELVAPIGSVPLIVADDMVWSLVGDTVSASFRAAGLPVHRETFGRYNTAAAVDTLAARATSLGADVVAGVGGGSAIDATKAAGFLAGTRWVSVPTIASTDAPCSALSVIYTEDGGWVEDRLFPRNPDLVLVDTQMI